MTTPAGAIGEADVRIVADTSGFRQEVERDTGAIPPVDVRVRPDTTGFRAAVRAATRGMAPVTVRVRPSVTGFRQDLRARLSGLPPVPVAVRPDTTIFRRELRTRLAALPSVAIPVRPDTTIFRRELRTRLLNLPPVSVPVRPDMTVFRRELIARTRSMAAVTVPVRPNLTFFRAQVRAAARGVGVVTVRVRCVRVGGEPCGGGVAPGAGGGSNGGGDGGSGSARRAANNANLLVRSLTRVNSVFASIGGIVGRQSAAMGYAIVTLIAILSPLVGLLALIPGLLALAGAGFLVFQENAERLGKTMSKLGDTINKQLNSAAVKPFFDAAGDSMNNLIVQFDKFFASSEGAKLLADSMKILKFVLDGINESIVPVMNGFQDFVRETLPQWERIGDAIERAGVAFGKWLTKVSETGQASRWLDRALTALREIAALAASISGAFGSLFGPMSTGISDLTTNLTKLFEEASPGLEKFGEGFGKLLEAVTPLLPILGKLSSLFTGAFGEFFKAVSPGLKEFVKVFAEEFGPLIEKITPYVEKFAEFGGKLISEFLEIAAPYVKTLAEELGKVFTEFKKLLDEVFAPLQPYIPQIKDFLKKLGELAADGAKFMAQLASAGIRLYLKAIKPLIVFLSELTRKFLDWLTKTEDGKATMDALEKAFNFVKDAVKGLVGWLRDAYGWLTKVIDVAGKLSKINIGGVGGSIFDKIPGLGSFFADGGIVTGPTRAVVGEAGPEVVLPLTRPKRLAELLQKSGALEIAAKGGLGMGGGGRRLSAGDVSVNINTAATQHDILIRKWQRAMAAALS